MSQTWNVRLLLENLPEYSAIASMEATGTKGGATGKAAYGSADFTAIASFEASSSRDMSGEASFDAVASMEAQGGRYQYWPCILNTGEIGGSASFEASAALEIIGVAERWDWYPLSVDVLRSEVAFGCEASCSFEGVKGGEGAITPEAVASFAALSDTDFPVRSGSASFVASASFAAASAKSAGFWIGAKAKRDGRWSKYITSRANQWRRG